HDARHRVHQVLAVLAYAYPLYTVLSSRFGTNVPLYGAVEEALVNAVYHRSYQDDSPVEVRVFPNRIEILSYPGPVPPLGKDNLMSRKVTAVAWLFPVP
ncbi:unnamed protein product, partial [marine sediment metagenome]